MKRTVTGIMLFIVAWIGTILFSYTLNKQTPEIVNGSSLPAHISDRQYSVSGLTADPNTGDCHILFWDCPQNVKLSLILSDSSNCDIYQGEEHIFTYRKNDEYKRVMIVPIQADEKGKLELTIHSDNHKENFEPDATGGLIPRLKVAIGPSTLAQRSADFALFVNALSLGMYLLIILTTLTLFVNKKSETYLFALFLVAVASCCATLLTSSFVFVSISQQVYQAIRKLVVVFPLVPNAAFSIYLVSTENGRLRRFVSFHNILLFTVLALGIQAVFPVNLYHVYRALFLLPTVSCIVFAYKKGNNEALPLLLGAAICEGLHSYVYLVNSLRMIQPGLPVIYLRFSQPGYLINQLFGLLVICKRFADKFTEAQFMSEQLAEINHSLDKKVEERTEELKLEQERRHGMMLNIFHDLGSPIFVMRGCVNALMREGKYGDNELMIIKERLNYLDRLIEDLFSLAKFETDEMPFDFDEINIRIVLENILTGSRIVAKEKHIRLKESLCQEAYIWGDEVRLRQMFQNLISNAMAHANAEGEVLVALETDPEFVRVRVSDNGEGIRREDLPHVFERYYRSPVQSEKTRSFGLGLAIAKEIADAHRGSITVSSIPYTKTEFIVQLPKL